MLGLISSWLGGRERRKASERASEAQQAMAKMAIDEQRRQFDRTQELLSPYVETGNNALTGYGDLLGLNGVKAQQGAVNNIEQSPMLQALYKQADNAILQNASATGGLRGGNTQEALADNRMNMLYQNILQQQQNLGGLATMGQNSASGVGNAGMTMANNVGSQLNGIGASMAGNHLAQGQAKSDMYKSINQGLGALLGMGMGGGLF